MENNRNRWFTRILIIVFCVGLAIMIGVSFFCVQPYGELKNGIPFLLVLLLVLVLAESFDSFSIGKILSFKREIKNKEAENKKLEQKNAELISNLLSITNSQQSTNVLGNYYYSDIPKNLQPTNTNRDNVQELIDRIGSSITITEIESNIKRELTEKGLETESETVKVLLRHLAGTQLFLTFEQIHSIIFGSQLHLLKLLNSSSSGFSEEEVSRFFEGVVRKFPDPFKNWTEKEYLSYLYSSLLITKKESKVDITNLGVEYLTWIIRDGVSENKPL